MAQVAKMAISLDPELLGRIDAVARRRHVTRSAFVRDAVEDALAREQRAAIAARIDAVFSHDDASDEQRASAEALGQDFLAGLGDDSW